MQGGQFISVQLVDEQVIRCQRIRQRHAAGKLRGDRDLLVPGLLAGVRSPEDDLDPLFEDPGLLQQGGERRAGPGAPSCQPAAAPTTSDGNPPLASLTLDIRRRTFGCVLRRPRRSAPPETQSNGNQHDIQDVRDGVRPVLWCQSSKLIVASRIANIGPCPPQAVSSSSVVAKMCGSIMLS